MYVAFTDIKCLLPITSSVEYALGQPLWAQIKTGHYQPVAYREGGVWGVQHPPPRNSEDIGGVLDRTSKKNRRLDFLL